MLFDEIDYLTVTEVNAQARALLEETYPDICVLGEISNFKKHSSGHLYFTLKDAEAQLRVACFRREARRLVFDPEDGIQVRVRGRLTVYESYGNYQLVAHAIEEHGAGALEAAFRELKEKLAKEGLFEAEDKRELPRYPRQIAVVTSPTGAAVRDIVSALRRRWPVAGVLLCPVRVQGPQAPGEIVEMLDWLGDRDDIDVIIVGRGGGSLEDLWAFNEEPVARAIHRCAIPVISAVGHETDFTIADFVADARAATPTMAAEMAAPQRDEVRAGLDDAVTRLVRFIDSKLEIRRARLNELLRSYALGQVRGMIDHAMQRHDVATDRLVRGISDVIRARTSRLLETMARLEGLDARSILGRGYTLCSDAKTGKIVRSVAAAVSAGNLHVTFHDGKVMTEVKEKIHEQGQG